MMSLYKMMSSIAACILVGFLALSRDRSLGRPLPLLLLRHLPPLHRLPRRNHHRRELRLKSVKM